jgi:hypothetical protein
MIGQLGSHDRTVGTSGQDSWVLRMGQLGSQDRTVESQVRTAWSSG